MQPGGKQCYRRTKMVLPVRLCLEGANNRSREATVAHTVDISPVGAQLGGFRISLQPGEVIILQHRHNKGRFRVIWTKQVGPAELRAGVEWVAIEKSVGIEINFWGLELSPLAQVEHHSNPSSDTSFATWLRQFK
jgi:hypothetical protein